MKLLHPILTALASLALVAFAAITPVQALTLQEAMAEVGGMYCSGSTCTSSTDGTRTETIIGSETRVVGYGSPSVGSPIEWGKSSTCFFGNGWAMINVNPVTCAGQSLALSGGSPITREFQTSTDVTIATRTTVTKELVYNGPNTSRDMAWSVNTTTETVDLPAD